MTKHQFKPIRKAVFPVAGLGTRFLPATKALPKEMLPINDRPLIQHAWEEAKEAGLVNVEQYQNKPTVIDALNRVYAGEDAAAVDAELKPAEDEAATSSDAQPAASDTKEPRKANGAVNLGHPRHFDETGNPIYLADEV